MKLTERGQRNPIARALRSQAELSIIKYHSRGPLSSNSAKTKPQLANGSGVQFPKSSAIAYGFIRSISDVRSKVNGDLSRSCRESSSYFDRSKKEADVLRSAVPQSGEARSLLSASIYSINRVGSYVKQTKKSRGHPIKERFCLRLRYCEKNGTVKTDFAMPRV